MEEDEDKDEDEEDEKGLKRNLVRIIYNLHKLWKIQSTHQLQQQQLPHFIIVYSSPNRLNNGHIKKGVRLLLFFCLCNADLEVFQEASSQFCCVCNTSLSLISMCIIPKGCNKSTSSLIVLLDSLVVVAFLAVAWYDSIIWLCKKWFIVSMIFQWFFYKRLPVYKYCLCTCIHQWYDRNKLEIFSLKAILIFIIYIMLSNIFLLKLWVSMMYCTL